MTTNPKREKLNKLLYALTTVEDEKIESFEELDAAMLKLVKRVKEHITLKAIDDINKDLNEFKKDLNLEPLFNAINGLKGDSGKMFRELSQRIKNQMDDLSFGVKDGIKQVKEVKGIGRIFTERAELLKKDHEVHKGEMNARIADYEKKAKNLSGIVSNLEIVLDIAKKESSKHGEDNKKEIKRIEELIEQARMDIFASISRISKGGNANRQINVNSSVMSTLYTDINFQQFGNIGWTAINDDTNKRVNIRASILSGGGAAGTTRIVSSIATNTTGAAVASTDYVYFAQAGITFTLPTAIGNSNLYTLKNDSTASVLVATTAGQTIDDSATALMPTENESLSFISNNSVWGVV